MTPTCISVTLKTKLKELKKTDYDKGNITFYLR